LGGQAINPLLRQYHPELSSPWMLVLDGREPMLFGSRGRLKWVQALRAALSMAALSAEQGDEMALLTLLDDGLSRQAAMPAKRVLGSLMTLAAEDSKLPAASSENPSIWPLLQQAMRSMAPGSRWLLLSEARGLYQALELHMPLVQKLANRFDIRAVELTDPLDEQLPQAGELNLYSGGGVSRWRSDSSLVRDEFHRRQVQALAAGRASLISSGIECRTLSGAEQDPTEALLA
ncbi:MAG: hypothetical protein ACPG4N_07790, partial [Gammaproteobacteria bacterium]